MIRHFIEIATGRADVCEQSPFLTWLLAHSSAACIVRYGDGQVFVNGIPEAEAKRLTREFLDRNELDLLRSRLESNRYGLPAKQRIGARISKIIEKYADRQRQ